MVVETTNIELLQIQIAKMEVGRGDVVVFRVPEGMFLHHGPLLKFEELIRRTLQDTGAKAMILPSNIDISVLTLEEIEKRTVKADATTQISDPGS